jgi:general secretion pathway protein H
MVTGKALSNKATGFSLIELLVVMAIMALMVSVVSLSIGGVGAQDRADDAAVSLRAMLETAATQAIVRHQPIAMHWQAPSQTGSEQWQFRWSGWRQNQWLDEIAALPAAALPPGVTPDIVVDGLNWSQQNSELPVLVFYPTGETMAFTLTLSGKQRMTISNEADGVIEIKGDKP